MNKPATLDWTPFRSLKFPTDEERAEYDRAISEAVERLDYPTTPHEHPFAAFARHSCMLAMVRQFVDIMGREPEDNDELDLFYTSLSSGPGRCDECGASLSPLVETIEWVPTEQRLPAPGVAVIWTSPPTHWAEMPKGPQHNNGGSAHEQAKR